MTKEQLKAYRSIRLERDRLSRLIAELEATVYAPRSPKLDGMPRGGSGPSRPTEDAAVKRAELLHRYIHKEAELSVALLAIEQAIETLEPRERTLIRLHYAEGLTWEEVCVAMSYGWAQVHRIHAKALEKLRTEKATE